MEDKENDQCKTMYFSLFKEHICAEGRSQWIRCKCRFGEKDNIFKLFIAREYSKAVKEIMLLADKANQYIDSNKPWELNKEEANSEEVRKIASTAINLFRILNLYLEPVIPETSEKIKNYLKSNQSLNDLSMNLVNHQLEIFKPLMFRIEDAEITKLNEISQNG